MNDLATVNRINEDNALLHQQNCKKLSKHNPHNCEVTKVIQTSDGEKRILVDTTASKHRQSGAPWKRRSPRCAVAWTCRCLSMSRA